MTKHELLIFLTERKKAYQLTFTPPAGETVMKDLTPFCRAKRTCIIPGDRDRTYVLEGRREVYLRIQQHLEMTPEQLYEMVAGQPFTEGNDNG